VGHAGFHGLSPMRRAVLHLIFLVSSREPNRHYSNLVIPCAYAGRISAAWRPKAAPVCPPAGAASFCEAAVPFGSAAVPPKRHREHFGIRCIFYGMAIHDHWVETLRCPRCGKTGVARLSQADGWHALVDQLPEGFKFVGLESGSNFYCSACDRPAEP
jgi:hypothetical protein